MEVLTYSIHDKFCKIQFIDPTKLKQIKTKKAIRCDEPGVSIIKLSGESQFFGYEFKFPAPKYVVHSDKGVVLINCKASGKNLEILMEDKIIVYKVTDGLHSNFIIAQKKA